MRVVGLDIHRNFAEAVMIERGSARQLGRIDLVRERVIAFAKRLGKETEVVVEATGVERIGRITHGCTGLYSDDNERAMARVLAAARAVALPGTRFGIHTCLGESVRTELAGKTLSARRKRALIAGMRISQGVKRAYLTGQVHRLGFGQVHERRVNLYGILHAQRDGPF